jgi:hypothetical protein
MDSPVLLFDLTWATDFGALGLISVTVFVSCVLITVLQMTSFCIFMWGRDCSTRHYVSRIGSVPVLRVKIRLRPTQMAKTGETARTREVENSIFM